MTDAQRDTPVRFAPLLADQLGDVLRVEESAYRHPWNRTNFLDALNSGYQAQVLLSEDALLGYFVAMRGVDEVHLLNITVAPAHQGQGWAHFILDALDVWARGLALPWVWLEVRVSNTRALRVYEAHGYRRMGQRKDYYPDGGPSQREDAVVMSLRL
ncbi:MAG: ribosomal protein S18-alanine N-acetyltransferase [Rhodoferax sp.]